VVLTITAQDPLPPGVQARVVSTLNSTSAHKWATSPFVRADATTLVCRVSSGRPGLKSFRAEFSLDGGATWVPDTVPDAWILIDPPLVDGLRVYVLIPNVSGTVANWIADLKRIRDMGFNAVHLLPITTLDTSESPYAASNLFDIDPGYLTSGSPHDGLAQFEEYVAAAKALKIRLCFDLVLNHVGATSMMARRAPDWIVPDESEPDGFRRARYWTSQGWRAWDDLVLINYDHPSEAVRSEIWAYMAAYTLFWARYASDTGGLVRFDNLHSGDPEFIQSVTTALHSEYPEVGLLAEYFTDERTMLRTGPEWGLNLVLATPWDYKFVPQLREYLNYLHRISEHVRYFMPVTSHDCGAPAQEFGTADSTVPRYVAAALLGTGATGMPQGVELGERERIDFMGRKPRMRFPEQPRFARFVGRVNAILADHAAFRRGANCRFVDGGHPAILAAFRRDSGTQAIGFLVVCNFDIHSPQRIMIDVSTFLGEEGTYSCRELLSDDPAPPRGRALDLTLPPCSARVLMFHKP
jgi:starch synthase (maltosyl-transferring)